MTNISIAVYFDRLVNEDPDATVVSPLRDVLLMMVLLDSHPSLGSQEGLLLVKSPKQQGAFERIGLFTIHIR
jgi:hypothetical protein